MKGYLFKVDRSLKQWLITGLVVFAAALLSNGCAAQSGQLDSQIGSVTAIGQPGAVQAEVHNVVTEQVGNRVVITYDLIGDEGKTEVFVEITIEEKAYRPSDLHMEGDFGEVATGRGKRIYWNVLRDFPRGFSGVVQWEIATGDLPTPPKPRIKASKKWHQYELVRLLTTVSIKLLAIIIVVNNT